MNTFSKQMLFLVFEIAQQIAARPSIGMAMGRIQVRSIENPTREKL
jgi:hypothetical protein